MKMQRYGKINSRQINICSQNIISPGTQIVLVSIFSLRRHNHLLFVDLHTAETKIFHLELLNVRVGRHINFIGQFTVKMKIKKFFSFYFLFLGSFENPFKGPGRHSEGEKDGGI